MPRVNTREQILQAAMRLFTDQGYQKTSIARIESEAGLVPRAGAFYRHFSSKQALLEEIAKTRVSESPEEFGLNRLADFGDTRSELIAIALKYEEALHRQKPFARLIEEVRALEFGNELQEELDTAMLRGLTDWIKTKPAAKGLSGRKLSALVINVFGGWLFYLSMVRHGPAVAALREPMLDEWATRWSVILDSK